MVPRDLAATNIVNQMNHSFGSLSKNIVGKKIHVKAHFLILAINLGCHTLKKLSTLNAR